MMRCYLNVQFQGQGVNVCNTIIVMYTTYERAVFWMIASNPNLFHYLLEYHLPCMSFWYTPTLLGTQVGCTTKVDVPRNPCTQENAKESICEIYDTCLWATGNHFQHPF